MVSLTRARMTRLLVFLDEIVEIESFLQISTVLLPAVARLMSATMVKYHYVYRINETFSIDIGWPSELFTLPNMAAFARVAHMHPLPCSLPMVLAKGPEQPLAVSDLMPRRAWQATEVYREAMKAVGGDDQMAMILGMSADNITGLVTLTRYGAPFTDADHQLLFSARAHIAAAARRAVRAGVTGTAMQTQPVARWIDLEELLPNAGPAGLSGRELEVLVLISEGLTSGQIGRRLGISPRTVDKHVEHVYRKIRVESRAAATKYLLARGGDPPFPEWPAARRHWIGDARRKLSGGLDAIGDIQT